jgi:cell division septal protein FtsQ
MATQQRKDTPAAKTKTEEPAGLSWQQSPAKPRKQMRRVQSTVGQSTVSQPATPGAQPRRAPARQRPRLGGSWQTYVRITLALLIVLGGIVGFWELLRLPQLTVTPNTTKIGGSQRISNQEIFVASQVDGHSIFLFRPADVAQRVKAVPGIASADVHVRLPNQVLIDVREHQPLVAWQAITTTLWLSADGAEVPQAGTPPALNLTDLSGTPVSESRPTWQAILPQLIAFRQALPDQMELSYGKFEGLYFRTPEGWTVWMGNDGIVAKLALLEAARREITARGEQPSVIDLRYSTRQAFWR